MLVVYPVVAQLKEQQPQAQNKALKYCSDDNRRVMSTMIREIESAGAREGRLSLKAPLAWPCISAGENILGGAGAVGGEVEEAETSTSGKGEY